MLHRAMLSADSGLLLLERGIWYRHQTELALVGLAGAMAQQVSDLRPCFSSLRGTGQTLLSVATPQPHRAAYWDVSGLLQPLQCSLPRLSSPDLARKRQTRSSSLGNCPIPLHPLLPAPTQVRCSQQSPSLAPGCSLTLCSYVLY